MPSLGSPDTDLNAYRDRIVARVRDLVRNDGWASAGITRILDNAVGANFRPVAKPDYRALAHVSGNKAFDADWATEFGRALDAHWRAWAQDLGRYCDVQRALTMPQVFRLAYRHKLIDGDARALGDAQTRKRRFDHDAVRAEVARLASSCEARDVAVPLARRAVAG
nr:phage portal protein [Caballeronia zhejiangensis]